jgi:hypothetical protein
LPLLSVFEKEKERALSVVEEDEDEGSDEGEGTAPSTLEKFADSFVDYEGGMGRGARITVEETRLLEPDSRTQDTSSNKEGVIEVVIEENVQEKKEYEKQEEEESTQDLMMELEQHERSVVLDSNGGWVHPVVPVPVPVASQQQSGGSDENVIDSLEVAPKVNLFEISRQQMGGSILSCSHRLLWWRRRKRKRGRSRLSLQNPLNVLWIVR